MAAQLPAPAPATSTSSFNELDEKVKLFFNQAKTETQRPSAKLFSYYQSLNRGLPKYTFTDTPEGLMSAAVSV
jgi:hypothetical protein